MEGRSPRAPGCRVALACFPGVAFGPPVTCNASTTNAALVSGGTLSTASPPCDDSDEYTSDACDLGAGQCVFTPVPDGTPCTDTDANVCTLAACENSEAYGSAG
jgi:hypothetical protein